MILLTHFGKKYDDFLDLNLVLLENSLLARFSPLVAATQKEAGQHEDEAECITTNYSDTRNNGLDVDLSVKLMRCTSLEENESNCVNQDMINEILRKTSAAVEDIGSFLKSNGETKPVRG